MIKRIIAAAVAASIMVCAVPTVAITSMAYGGNPSDSEIGKPTGKTDDLEWSVENNVLTITGEGPMYDYHRDYDVLWNEYKDTITEIVIGEGVTNVGTYCGAYFPELTKVTLPSTLTSISSYAFTQSEKLAEITIPDKVEFIGQCAFYRDSSLTKINIPAAVKKIDVRAFDYCTSLETAEIAENSCLETIGSSSFNACKKLKEFIIPDTVTILGSNPFDGCYSLEKMVYGKSLTKITSHAFYRLTSLKTFICRGDVKSIGSSAFENCINLETFEVPDTVETIESKAFYFCQSLTEFPNLENVANVAENAFDKSGVVTADNADGVVFSVGNVYVSPEYAGKNVTVPVKIKGNKSFCRSIISMIYDNKLTYADAQPELMGWLYMKNSSSERMEILGECYTDEDGILANLTFKLPDDIKSGDSFGIYVSSFDFENSDEITEGYEKYSVFGGKIRVVDSSIKGDVNDDGKLDASDVKALQRFILAKSTAADSVTSDLNGDGVVNLIDLAMLKEMLLK